MCWIPFDPVGEGEPIKKEDKMYTPTIEDLLAKIEDELENLGIWMEAYEEDMDMTVAEIEKRLTNLERFSRDGK